MSQIVHIENAQNLLEDKLHRKRCMNCSRVERHGNMN